MVSLSGPLSQKLAKFKAPPPASPRGIVVDVRSRQWGAADNSISRMRDRPIVVRPNPQHIPVDIAAPKVFRRSIDKVMRAVEIVTEVSVKEQKSSCLNKHTCRARQIAMYLAYRCTNRSTNEIAACMGNRHHTSIIHGVRKISSMIEAGDPVKDTVAAVYAVLVRAGYTS